MIKLKIDSRDALFHQKFGQTTDFPLELNFDSSIVDVVQVPGDVECTTITICDIAADQDKVVYDYKELFSRVPHDEHGADPRAVFGEAIKNGLKTLTGGIVKHWTSYWKAHTGDFDAFDNVRSTMTKAQSSISVWSEWFAEWNGQTILPFGKTPISNHMYEIEGWKIVNGQPALIVEPWLGYKPTIGRDEFNALMARLGSNTAVFSTAEIDAKRAKTIIEAIIDAYKNIILLLKQQMAQQPVTVSSSQKLYDLSFSLIGKHLSLDDSVPHEFGCAQALSKVLLLAGYPIPKGGISGTIAMNSWLAKNFTEVSTPQMGDTVISLTNGNVHGHCGINGKDAIMSNDSLTGNWQPYWSLAGWLNSYKNTEHLVTKFYRTP